MKRYIDEGEEEAFVGYVQKTRDKPDKPLDESLRQIKDRLLRRRAIPVRDALEVVNSRKLTQMKGKKRTPPSLNN